MSFDRQDQTSCVLCELDFRSTWTDERLQKIEDATGISFEYPSIKNIKGFDIKGSYVSVGNIKTGV